MEQYCLGVEIGGNKQLIYVCNEIGGIIEKFGENIPHPNGALDILKWLEINVTKILDKYPEIKRIGVGFGGPLESATGRVLCSVHVPGWKDFELKTWFETTFKREAIVAVDTVAGGYAEYKLGSGRNSKIFFYTNIGTGIGGSLFVDGKVYEGIGFGAAYLGNTYVADWTSNIPGAIARLECMSSGINIEARLRSAGYIPKDSMLYEICGGDISKVTGRELKKAIELGDTFAVEELDRVACTYGVGLGNAVSMLGVDTISIGGGIANYGEVLRSRLEKYANEVVFINGKNRFKIVISELMDDNVPIGAALFARDGFNTI